MDINMKDLAAQKEQDRHAERNLNRVLETTDELKNAAIVLGAGVVAGIALLAGMLYMIH